MPQALTAAIGGATPVVPSFLDGNAVTGILVFVALIGLVLIGLGIIYKKNGRIKEALESAGRGLIGFAVILAALLGTFVIFATGALDFISA